MKCRGICMLLALLGLVSSGFGRGGALSTPLFGYPSGLNADQIEKAQAALTFMREELKFIDGRFINQFFHHRFGATVKQTKGFLKLLDEAGAWKVHVQFKDFGVQDTAFTLDQNMAGNTVEVCVNSARDDFRLKDFQAYLPQTPQAAVAPMPR